MAAGATRGVRSTAPLAVRAHPLVLGVVLFLASELMFFAALFAAYYDLRANRAAWPPPAVRLDALEAGCGTFLLFAASAVMVFATRAMDRARWRAARGWIASAIVAALGFIALSLHGYAHSGIGIATNAYGSIYYTLTGFHLLHVTAGIGILAALLVGLRSPALRVDHRAGAEALTYYWHFVFVVWLGIYGTVYLIR